MHYREKFMDWKQKAVELKFTQGKSWTETSKEIQETYFDGEDYTKVHEKVRRYLRSHQKYQQDKYLEKKEPKIIKNKWTGDRVIRFGLLGDTHFNSKYTQYTHLHSYYDILQKEGITEVYHTGDIDEGEQMRPGQVYENHIQGADEHIENIITIYPQRKNITTHFITGNHDTSIFKRVGFDIGKVIADRRSDMDYYGKDWAVIYLTPKCTMELRHPWDGGSYAMSYKPQKMIESISGGDKPNIIAIGHYHKSLYMEYRNVHAFLTGTFQAQTPFMKGKGLAANMGGWIIEIHVDDKGTINRIKPEFIPYYVPIKEDWKNWI